MSATVTAATAEDLQRLAEFDHPFIVRPGGILSDDVTGIYAPDIFNDEADDITNREGWTPLTGYTGQHGYNGAVMHASEYLGGGLARDVLSTPGVYVVVVVEVLECDETCEPAGADCPGEHEPAGWAILRHTPRDAGLGVGHIWTATACPAYATLYGPDCTCDGTL